MLCPVLHRKRRSSCFVPSKWKKYTLIAESMLKIKLVKIFIYQPCNDLDSEPDSHRNRAFVASPVYAAPFWHDVRALCKLPVDPKTNIFSKLAL
jgi:hypothetical protein